MNAKSKFDSNTRPRWRAGQAGLLFVALGVAFVSGCVDNERSEDATPDAPAIVDWATVEQTPAMDVAFPVETQAGGGISVAGYAWLPDEGADTAVLVVHGGGGLALRQFGPAPVPGYSLAHRIVESGRAVVVIDRPGYGGSDDPIAVHTLDDDASIVAQIAETLRDGHEEPTLALGPFSNVIALGHSIGAFIVMLSEGDHGVFDGIVPTAWSHAGFRQGAPEDCLSNFRVDCIMYAPNADPAMVEFAEQAIRDAEGDSELRSADFLVRSGAWRSAHPTLQEAGAAPDPDDLPAGRVVVPVLMLLGLEDGMAEPANESDERAVFSSANDVSVVHFEETSHWIFHHLNRDSVSATILDWLDERHW